MHRVALLISTSVLNYVRTALQAPVRGRINDVVSCFYTCRPVLALACFSRSASIANCFKTIPFRRTNSDGEASAAECNR
jgi:hypothetical protein